jgi:uncharacterized membrane protein
MTASLTSFLPIVNKRLLAAADVRLVSWAINGLSVPVLAAAAALLDPGPSVRSVYLPAALAAAALNAGATLASMQALKLADASLVTPLLNFSPAFSLLVAGVALGEVPNSRGLMGVALIVVGAYLFGLEGPFDGIRRPVAALVSQPGVRLALLAAFVWALTPVAEKLAMRHATPVLVALTTRLGTSLLLAPALLRPGRDNLGQLRSGWRGFTAVAAIAGVAPLLGFTAVALGYVAYVTALFKLGAVLTVVWARLLLGELGLRQRLPGSIVMAAGAFLIAS